MTATKIARRVLEVGALGLATLALAVADFGGKDSPAGAALQPDGKLVVAGQTPEQPVVDSATAVARFDESGKLDPTFAPGGADGDGELIVPESGYDTVEAVALRPGGDIALVGGATGPGPAGAELERPALGPALATGRRARRGHVRIRALEEIDEATPVALACNAQGDLHVLALDRINDLWHTIRAANGAWPHPSGHVQAAVPG